MDNNTLPPVIFFDGYCNLCSWAVVFILKREKEAYFHFASLQSKWARENLPGKFQPTTPETLIVWDDDQFYTHSNGALIIAKHLRFPWNVLGIFKILPQKLRDIFYSYVAKRRYKWFGKKELCMVPPPSLKERFFN